MTRRTDGLTLVELLVAMALIGIIFALVTNWQASTLELSTRTNATSQRLSELNDVTGYLGDRVRSAIGVRTGGFTVNSASAVSGGNCTTSTPCLAVLVPEEKPEEKTVGGLTTIIYKPRYLTLIYRIEPRTTLSDDDWVRNVWADNLDNNVRVLREYRLVCDPAAAATPNCTSFISNFASTSAFAGAQPFLVADYLTTRDQSGGVITPFEYTPATRTVRLSFQGKQQVRGKVQYTPATPYTLDVQARNLP